MLAERCPSLPADTTATDIISATTMILFLVLVAFSVYTSGSKLEAVANGR